MKADKSAKRNIAADDNFIRQTGGCDSPVLLKRYAYKITDAVRKTIKGSAKDDPVAKQYIPQAQELKILPEERIDPIGDEAHTPVKGIVHRHQDRVLLKLSNVCAVYCRYCFRREMIGPGAGVLTAKETAEALAYIRANEQIREVILTGGDPLVLAPRLLNEVLDKLERIKHVQILRIHSRVPIVAPDKISEELCSVLSRKTALYMALHINHANEITPDVERALERLRKSGCILLSQSVLLKGVNDNAQVLEDLFRALVALRVKPYYLHHPDLTPGTSHFRLSIKEGQEIMRALQGRVSGLCLPHYILDIPGGHGKVPISPCYITETNENTYSVESPGGGGSHIYPPENGEAL